MIAVQKYMSVNRGNRRPGGLSEYYKRYPGIKIKLLRHGLAMQALQP